LTVLKKWVKELDKNEKTPFKV